MSEVTHRTDPPSSDECSKNAPYLDPELGQGYAGWYPQMGGYVGKCVVFPGENVGDCFDVLVWHDGEFPFNDEYGDTPSPAHLHHCMTEQFREFADFVDSLSAMIEDDDA